MADSEAAPVNVEPFRWNPDDPLAAEHRLVSDFIAEMIASGWQPYSRIHLDHSSAGQKIVSADPAAGTRIVSSLLAHSAYFDDQRLKLPRTSEGSIVIGPEFHFICNETHLAEGVLRQMLRRKLPFTAEHLARLADWICAQGYLCNSLYPLESFVKAVLAYGQIGSGEAALRSALSRLIQRFRSGGGSGAKELPRFAYQLETLLGAPADEPPSAPEQARPRHPNPIHWQPAPVGCGQVLVGLKQFLKILPPDTTADMTIGLDRFLLRADSPLKEEHELISMFLPEVVGTAAYHEPLSIKTAAPTWRAMLSRDPRGKGRLLLAAAERYAHTHFYEAGISLQDYELWQSNYAIQGLFTALLSSEVEVDYHEAFDVLLLLTALSGYHWTGRIDAVEKWFRRVVQLSAAEPLTPGQRHVLHRLRCQAVQTSPFGKPDQLVSRISQMLGDHAFLALVPGEAWSDAVNADLEQAVPATRESWLKLLMHAAAAAGSRPSGKWLKAARERLKAVNPADFSAKVLRWFPLVDAPRTIQRLGGTRMSGSEPAGAIHNDNAMCLRGLLWMTPEVASPELIRAIGALTVSCYRKIPGIGPRAVKVGNAGVYALSQIDDPLALGQLALLKVKVKFGSAQKEIEKAFNVAAERSGLPRDEIEEMSVPTYGLTEVGCSEEQLGDFKAHLTVTGTTSTELLWVKPDGKVQRSVPAAVRENHQEDLKELKTAAKDIQQMLPAQRERIDSLFLQQKSWALAVWRERYLDHPLIGTLARRMLWEFKTGAQKVTGIWFKNQLVDLDLRPVPLAPTQTTVQLWHPIGKTVEEITAWRGWLDAQQIQQPFKQAHREIYVLTDAEQNTRTYSNRYAAHVLKQHQFNALCAVRGWKNQLRLMVDAAYPPATLHLPPWDLRAEFWIEGLGSDYGTDTNETGTYLYLSTDQVRFYRVTAAQRLAHAGGGGYHPGIRGLHAEPLPLDEIPPLVFSEVMRDVDLFVGVTSVGNDPTWADGGPEGRYRDYWQHYSFGELNASARTRKEVLERLVPRLKIANQCSFVDRYLVVKGSLRTYKIHLGSGNILMEPNDQYLCIVATQGAPGIGEVLLPFEGDRTLSIILSKAFLLADDAKITDGTITRQIGQR